MSKTWTLKLAFMMMVMFVSAHRIHAQTPEPTPGQAIIDDMRTKYESYVKTHGQLYFHDFKVNVVDEIHNERHSEIKIHISEKGPWIEFNIDKAAIRNPHLAVLNIALLSYYTHCIVTSSVEVGYFSGSAFKLVSLAEVMKNAEAGSPTAINRLAQLEVIALSQAHVSESFPNREAAIQVLDKEREKNAELIPRLAESTKKYLRDQQKKIDQWREKTQALEKYESMSEKLNDLILNNDRKGVAKMITAYLPWAVMEPVEAEAWKIWIQAIENPDHKKTTIAFRGVDYQTDKIQRKQTANGEVIGFMSTVLTKNQGNYTRRLRSLSTNRLKNGDYRNRSSSPSVHIVDQMFSHAKEPTASSFLSFTWNAKLATGFMGDLVKKDGSTTVPNGGFLVVKMDSRRLIPNIVSSYPGEVEFLAPLIVFPDEVIRYIEYTSVEAKYEAIKFADELSKSTKIPYSQISDGYFDTSKNGDGESLEKAYFAEGFNFLKQISSKVSKARAANSCSKVML